MSELEISDRAFAVASEALYEARKDKRTLVVDAAELTVRAAAPLIVAAELRRIAALATKPRIRAGYLVERADELDPEGRHGES